MVTFPVSCILCIIWSMYFLVPCHLPMPQLSCQWHSTTGQLWLSLWKTFLKVLRKFTEQSHARLGQKCTQKVAETEIDNTSRIQEKKKKSRKSIESYRKKKKKKVATWQLNTSRMCFRDQYRPDIPSVFSQLPETICRTRCHSIFFLILFFEHLNLSMFMSLFPGPDGEMHGIVCNHNLV